MNPSRLAARERTGPASGIAVLIWMTLAQAGATLNQQGLGGLAPAFSGAFRLDHASLGVLYGAVYLGSTLFTAPAGILVDRYGERAIVVWSGIGMAAAIAISAAVVDYRWLTAWLVVFGAGYAASSPAGGRAILRWFSRNRGFAMGVRQAGAPAGGTFGAVVLPLIALHGGYRAALLAGAAVCGATALLAGVAYRDPPQSSATPAMPERSLVSLVRDMGRFVVDRRALAVNVTGFILASAQYTAVAFLVVELLQSGTPRVVAGSALAVMQGVAVVARPAWGIASDRVFRGDRTIPIALMCVLAAIAATVLSLGQIAALSPVVTIGIALAFGCSAIAFTGIFNTILAEIGGIASAGSAMGVGLTFNYAAGFITPPLFGVAVDGYGFGIAWRILAATLVAGAAIILTARRGLRVRA